MTSYAARVLPSLVLISLLLPGCATRRDAHSRDQAAPPAPNAVRSDGAASLEKLLAGRISGVVVTPAPGGGIIVRMGGPTSFSLRQDPLFVVDGVPIEGGSNGNLSWLDPHDVESIEALKYPSATAIYGVRGANGVIVIKTRGSH